MLENTYKSLTLYIYISLGEKTSFAIIPPIRQNPAHTHASNFYSLFLMKIFGGKQMKYNCKCINALAIDFHLASLISSQNSNKNDKNACDQSRIYQANQTKTQKNTGNQLSTSIKKFSQLYMTQIAPIGQMKCKNFLLT